VHVVVSSAERSFSQLKLLMNYLRSPFTQERLNDLMTLCIEKLLDKIDINTGFESMGAHGCKEQWYMRV
jgi:hypothetical protein